jgi:DNA processing protein
MEAARQSQTAALVALLRRPRARWQDIAAEVLGEGEAVGVLKRTLGSSDTLFPDHEAMRAAHDDALDELRAWEQSGIAVHSLLDATYPARLRDIREMPPVVFTRGVQADDRRAVAVVGTRKPSDRGLSDAQAIATALAESGVTVVSGLALGIDTAAHTAALRAGGRTVAVIGTGVNRFYPAQNRELQQRIVREGLVLSQFWPDASPTRQSFPMRNAVMSGYSAATVVVEAAYQSGARIQARLALQHGRPVVLAESLLQHDWARSYAGRPGVVVVSSKDQLIAAVNQIVEQIPNADDALEGLPRLADA